MIERWDDLRFFLALAREGTLTAAATALGVSQPTVGRRISVLEKKVGTPLIERRPEGYRLSDAGQAVVAQAECIEAAVVAADRATAFDSRSIRGTVKLTSVEWLCGTVLAPALARFGQRHPDMTVELVAEARWLNLPRGESNLAIRAARFEHPGLLQRRVAISEVGVYATSEYLKARGPPDLAAGSPGHCFVTLTEDAGSRRRRVARGPRFVSSGLGTGKRTPAAGIACGGRRRTGAATAVRWRRHARTHASGSVSLATTARAVPGNAPRLPRDSRVWAVAESWWPRSRRWRRSSRLDASSLAETTRYAHLARSRTRDAVRRRDDRSQALPPPRRVLRQAPASVLEEPPGSDTPLRVFGAPTAQRRG